MSDRALSTSKRAPSQRQNTGQGGILGPMHSAQRIPEPWTPDEYLEREEQSLTKNELIEGQIYAMAGTSPRHDSIAGNTFAALHALARRCGCRAHTSDLRIHVPATGLFTYADALVVCGTPEYFKPKKRGSTETLLNPTLIMEVLSPSTEEYDRGDKFQSYLTIASLQEVLFLWQDEQRAEHHLRQGGAWVKTEVREGAVPLPALGAALDLSEVYFLLP